MSKAENRCRLWSRSWKFHGCRAAPPLFEIQHSAQQPSLGCSADPIWLKFCSPSCPSSLVCAAERASGRERQAADPAEPLTPSPHRLCFATLGSLPQRVDIHSEIRHCFFNSGATELFLTISSWTRPWIIWWYPKKRLKNSLTEGTKVCLQLASRLCCLLTCCVSHT